MRVGGGSGRLQREPEEIGGGCDVELLRDSTLVSHNAVLTQCCDNTILIRVRMGAIRGAGLQTEDSKHFRKGQATGQPRAGAAGQRGEGRRPRSEGWEKEGSPG